MEKLTLTQEYTLCLLHKKMSSKSTLYSGKYLGYIVLSSFSELLISEKIEVDNKENIIPKSSFEIHTEYLNILYKDIQKTKPKTLKKWLEHYLLCSSAKEIVESVINGLVGNGYVFTESKRFFIKQTVYKTNISIIENIIKTLRTELLSKNKISAETAILAVLLQHSNILSDYLSENERKIQKIRIEELMKSNIGEKVSYIDHTLDKLNAIILLITSSGSNF
jgi:hypothetical protein